MLSILSDVKLTGDYCQSKKNFYDVFQMLPVVVTTIKVMCRQELTDRSLFQGGLLMCSYDHCVDDEQHLILSFLPLTHCTVVPW